MRSYILVDGWRADIRFSSAHIIAEYEKCGRLHGHTYAVHAKVFGKPDEKGIIMDFSLLKDLLRATVQELDHKVLIPEKNRSVTIKKQNDTILVDSLGKHYVLPVEDCVLLPIDSTSAENLAQYILDRITKEITTVKQVENIEIGVDEGFGQGARVSTTVRG